MNLIGKEVNFIQICNRLGFKAVKRSEKLQTTFSHSVGYSIQCSNNIRKLSSLEWDDFHCLFRKNQLNLSQSTFESYSFVPQL